MTKGFICVAGLSGEQHIRPVLRRGSLAIELLSLYGGPFDIGVIVDLGKATHQPASPHTEDYVFNPSQVSVIGVVKEGDFWTILNKVSRSNLKDIFGQELIPVGPVNYGTDLNSGKVSLGCLKLQEKPSIYLKKRENGKSQIRLWFNDGELQVNAGVTDIRLYRIPDYSPNEELIKKFNACMKISEEIIISVGLSRPFASSPEFDPINWLQVNNIFLKEKPVWQMRPISQISNS
ncbi:MAG: hypothetical protein FJ134_02075 [Deltaproteobacteria bacterium]|nr:hypothetical protein [Deltaproteobacteria bacterium]